MVDTGPIERLLHDFDAKLAAAGRTDADAQAFQSIFAEISAKLDRLADPDVGTRQMDPAVHELGARLDGVVSPVDLYPIETMLRSLEAKLEASAAAPVDREVVEQVADEVVRRLQDVSSRQVDLEAVAQQIDTIYDRIDTLAAKTGRADEGQPVLQQLLEKLRESEQASGSIAAESSAALNSHLAELRSEQAGADQRTQSRLADLQSILEMLGARLASIESELAADDVDEELLPPARSASPGPPTASAAHGADDGPEAGPQRSSQPKPASAGDPASQPSDDSEDFLIEPGAGAPQRAREARDLAQVIGPRTNPAVSVHIAAARRAAQAALAENNGTLNSGVVQTLASSERVQFAARGVNQQGPSTSVTGARCSSGSRS